MCVCVLFDTLLRFCACVLMIMLILYPFISFALDMDECASNATNPCNQICTNNDGGFECSCMSGFQLQSDRFTCEG